MQNYSKIPILQSLFRQSVIAGILVTHHPLKKPVQLDERLCTSFHVFMRNKTEPVDVIEKPDK